MPSLRIIPIKSDEQNPLCGAEVPAVDAEGEDPGGEQDSREHGSDRTLVLGRGRAPLHGRADDHHEQAHGDEGRHDRLERLVR